MLAAIAGDAHGFSVVVLSLSLSLFFGWAHELIMRFIFYRSHSSREWNKPQYASNT